MQNKTELMLSSENSQDHLLAISDDVLDHDVRTFINEPCAWQYEKDFHDVYKVLCQYLDKACQNRWKSDPQTYVYNEEGYYRVPDKQLRMLWKTLNKKTDKLVRTYAGLFHLGSNSICSLIDPWILTYSMVLFHLTHYPFMAACCHTALYAKEANNERPSFQWAGPYKPYVALLTCMVEVWDAFDPALYPEIDILTGLSDIWDYKRELTDPRIWRDFEERFIYYQEDSFSSLSSVKRAHDQILREMIVSVYDAYRVQFDLYYYGQDITAR